MSKFTEILYVLRNRESGIEKDMVDFIYQLTKECGIPVETNERRIHSISAGWDDVGMVFLFSTFNEGMHMVYHLNEFHHYLMEVFKGDEDAMADWCVSVAESDDARIRREMAEDDAIIGRDDAERRMF